MNENNRPVFAAYVRVSTEQQARDETYEGQREIITAWAEHNNADLKWYDDLGTSGESNINGPVVAKMMTDLQTDGMAGIVIKCLDRLSRNPVDLMLTYVRLHEMRKKLVSVMEGDLRADQDLNPLEELPLLTQAVFAGFNKRYVVFNLQRGFQRWITAGNKPGKPPKSIDWRKVKAWVEQFHLSKTQVAENLGMKRKQFWRRCKQEQDKIDKLGIVFPTSRPFGKAKAKIDPAPVAEAAEQTTKETI